MNQTDVILKRMREWKDQYCNSDEYNDAREDCIVELKHIIASLNDKWNKKYPTQTGYYWFYGWLGRKIWLGEEIKPSYYLVEVRQASNSLVYITKNQFIYPSEEPVEGHWIPAELPAPPEKEDK